MAIKNEKRGMNSKEIIPSDRMIFYKSYWEAVQGLSDQEVAEWVIGLLRYAFEGIQPDFKKDSALWRIFQIVDQNMIASSVNLHNGLKGGRPKK